MKAEDETPEERTRREDLERYCRTLARVLKEQMPPGVGFALLMFDFGAGGSFTYASNAERADFVKLLDEARQILRGGS